jgi:hypothetical protein
MKPGVVVVNAGCRKCGRLLSDESDLLVGLCNNSEACALRVKARVEVEEAFESLAFARANVERATKRYGDALLKAGQKFRCPTCGTLVDKEHLHSEGKGEDDATTNT